MDTIEEIPAQEDEAALEQKLAAAIEQTAIRTERSVLNSLEKIFGDGDEKSPNQMRILVRRIPLLCTTVEEMRKDIAAVAKSNEKTNDNINWGVRIVVAGVILALLKVVLIP